MEPAPTGPRHPAITGMVLTFNGERLLAECLGSLAFCDRILVVDSGSTDATLRIAREAGAEVIHNQWPGSMNQLIFALDKVKTPWVLSLDQDEICSTSLRESILREVSVAPPELCGFYVHRRSWYYDRFLRHSGWYPDPLLRVFRQGGVCFTQSGAHEVIRPVSATARTGRIPHDILHYPYANFRQHLDKINDYAQDGADDLERSGKAGGILCGLSHGLGRFLRIYVWKRGFLDGKAGFLNAAHGAFYAFLKYARVQQGAWGKPFERD